MSVAVLLLLLAHLLASQVQAQGKDCQSWSALSKVVKEHRTAHCSLELSWL